QYLPVERIDAMRLPLPFPLDSHLAYSGAAFARDFDFSYTPFEKAMNRTWQWYKDAKETP
ncbi:MAG: hypothetical protein QMD09_11075, partial [Desulfatibacillaceae bacterium]|nr:hypothetical protein [Desulfatibacillaceae bacterium]